MGSKAVKPKVLLISPSVISQMPLGMAYIAAMFEKKGCEVRTIVNVFKNTKDNETMLREARAFNPDIIGVSFLTLAILDTYRLTRLLKNEFGAPIIAGGVHPTFLPEEALENGFDIVVRGEGEEAVEELCDRYRDGVFHNLNEIAGVSYREGERIIQNPDRDRIKDLDQLPYPARHLFDKEDFLLPDGSLKGYERIFLGRGCPSRCTYCKSAMGRKYRHRSVANVIDEMRYVKEEYGTTLFTIGDDTFSLNKVLTLELCEAIVEADLGIKWTCGTRVNNVTKELVDAMKRAGCDTVSIGAESGSDETLELIKKGQKAHHIERAVELIHAAGIRVYFNVMTGFPWEGPDHVEDTIRLIERLDSKIHIISVLGTVTPVPGTEIYDTGHEEHGYTNYWLVDDPVYQNAGQALFQNVVNPYELSVYYQRNMYDDNYIFHDTFFKYTSEYKAAVRRLCYLIGRHNFQVKYQSNVKRQGAYLLGVLSRRLYEINSTVEKSVIGRIKRKNRLHNIRSADLKRVKM